MQSTFLLTNTEYNVTKQLEKKMEFLWHVDSYIKDAEQDGHKQAAEAFRKIKAEEEKHAKMLKDLLVNTVKSGSS